LIFVTQFIILSDESLLEYEKNTIQVFNKVSESVVFITSKSLQWDLFSMNVFEIPQGSGSGFVWDKKGHIVTNYHVIQNANTLSVKLKNGKSYDASIVGFSVSKDIAVLKIKSQPQDLIPVITGSFEDLKVGRKVLAIGNPFGLDQTLTVGIISALGRQIKTTNGRTIHDVIQTDAAINPGNSGGPLLDSKAKLIGINTAIITPSGGSAGIGFAVPINTVKRVVPQLIKYGKDIRPGLGVKILPDNIAKENNINGIAIMYVPSGSSAAKAGLKGMKQDWYGQLILGDIIIAINNIKVKNYDELSYQFEKYKIGESVKITFIRNGKEYTASVKLQQIQ
jgi:S1-C subfamily serine protease